MIVVTGASGQLGSQVVARLLERVPAEQIVASVRDPAAADGLRRRGVQVRRGDFAEPATLRDAFAGASRVLVISPDKLGEEGVALSLAAIHAAYEAEAERVIYTSHQGVRADPLFAPAADHARVESELAGLGRPYVSLRNGYYSTTSLRAHLGDALETGELVAPADGPVAWTQPEDLAAGAAAILDREVDLDGPTPPLNAGEALDLEGVAAILSELSGREIRRTVLDDADYVERLVEKGTPPQFATIFLGSFEASRRGDFAAVGPALADLIGHPPRSIRDSLAALVED